MVKKIWLGRALILIILSASFYMLMPDKLRIDFQKTRTIFTLYNPETEKFDDVQGIEYTRIFDGTTKMNAIRGRNISFEIIGDTTKWYRIARFKQNITVEDFVEFDNKNIDIENVPVSHQACFTNANGKIFEYLISNIEYNGENKAITSPFAFGKNMKVTFQDGYHIAKVVNNKIAPDKIIVRYKIKSDYECFNIRLFDPEKEVVAELSAVSLCNDVVTEKSTKKPIYINTTIECDPLNTSCKHEDYTKMVFNHIEITYYNETECVDAETGIVKLSSGEAIAYNNHYCKPNQGDYLVVCYSCGFGRCQYGTGNLLSGETGCQGNSIKTMECISSYIATFTKKEVVAVIIK